MAIVGITHTEACQRKGPPYPLGADRESCGRCRRRAQRITQRPLIVITMEGGLVQAVTQIGGETVDAIVLDFDTDGADLAELTQIGRRRSELAYVTKYRGPFRRPANAARITEVAGW